MLREQVGVQKFGDRRPTPSRRVVEGSSSVLRLNDIDQGGSWLPYSGVPKDDI